MFPYSLNRLLNKRIDADAKAGAITHFARGHRPRPIPFVSSQLDWRKLSSPGIYYPQARQDAGLDLDNRYTPSQPWLDVLPSRVHCDIRQTNSPIERLQGRANLQENQRNDHRDILTILECSSRKWIDRLPACYLNVEECPVVCSFVHWRACLVHCSA